MENNLEIYNRCAPVPEDAQTPITGGKLKGFTNVNPQYRIKRMTEVFGPCGIGWWTTPAVYNEVEQSLYDYQQLSDKYLLCHCTICLHYIYEGKEGRPVIGTGSSYAIQDGKLNDEHRKMAYTDAFSVCCKQIGIAGDVYWKRDSSSKYYEMTQPQEYAPAPVQAYAQQQPQQYAPQVQQAAPVQAYAPQAQPEYGAQAYTPQETYYAPPQTEPTPQQPQMTAEQARQIICSVGKYKGLSMGQIADMPRSGETLNWFTSRCPGTVESTAAQVLLRAFVM